MRLFRPGTELRRFLRSPMSRAALVVAACIPLLYGALYLWAFWNPTSHVDRLPVALVVQDAGATDSAGASVTAGTKIADDLTSKGTVAWIRTDAATAKQGLAAGTYYAVLTIPSQFSASVVTAGTDHPVKAPLEVVYDDANGVTARTIVASVMREVRTAVSDSIGEQMVSKVLVGVADLRTGLAKAADGATTLASGSDTAADGSAQLVAGTTTLASGLRTADSGATQLAAGAQQLADGTTALANGLPAAQQGAASLASGAKSLATGEAALATGLHSAATQTATLPAATTQLATGSAQVAQGLTTLSGQLTASSGTLATSTSQLRALLASQLPPGSTALTAFDAYTTQLSGSMGSVSTAVTSLSAGATAVAAGDAKLAAAAPSIASGLADAAAGADKLTAGAGTLAQGAGTLATKLGDASTGATTLANGSATLAAKTGELATGIVQLDDGAAQLVTGEASLNEGLGKLATGSHELADKLTTAVADVPDLSTAQQDANATVMSAPVALDASYLNQAQGVGEGMAPYFSGLALYVGAMIMWMLLRPVSQRLLAAPVPASRVVAQNATPALVLGAVQTALLTGTLVIGLGLRPNHPVAFVGFALLVSAAFVTLQQALNIWFGPAVGRLATLVLLMLQLTSAGGTYPVVTSDPFFQWLHTFMPMSQVVNGLREAITGDLNPLFWTSVTFLGVLTLASLVLSTWGAARARTWTIVRLHPSISL